jgi:hypothetical protein
VFDQAVRRELAALREHMAEIVCSLTAERLASLTSYRYIVNALAS